MTASDPTIDDLPALPDPFWYSGYDWIGALRHCGWSAVPSWGRDGWDLGRWPLVIVAYYDRPGCYGLCLYVEGDLDLSAYPTPEARDQATDRLAAFYWRYYQHGPTDLPASDDQLQPHHRGPFSWSRCQPATPGGPDGPNPDQGES
jgi:hypothetical protein